MKIFQESLSLYSSALREALCSVNKFQEVATERTPIFSATCNACQKGNVELAGQGKFSNLVTGGTTGTSPFVFGNIWQVLDRAFNEWRGYICEIRDKYCIHENLSGVTLSVRFRVARSALSRLVTTRSVPHACILSRVGCAVTPLHYRDGKASSRRRSILWLTKGAVCCKWTKFNPLTVAM
jgi:hypothetical protein